MVAPALSELLLAASQTTEPSFPPAQKIKLGGIDPLGLRQINFDLMDMVLPGVNNVARHIRPFTIATWAWRRAATVATKLGMQDIPVAVLQDFVARIEVVFVWSQFARDRNADLPGRDVFAALLQAPSYTFTGAEWDVRRKVRSTSTAISSPINYGPSLKTLGWLAPLNTQPGVMRPNPLAHGALDALEGQISDRLNHPAFSQFGAVTVTAEEALAWSEAWRLDQVTIPEQEFMKGALCGPHSSQLRRSGVELVKTVLTKLPDAPTATIRKGMSGKASNQPLGNEIEPTVALWKQVQTRQLFRLSLEAMFYWLRKVLTDGPKSTENLVQRFLDGAQKDADLASAQEWLSSRGKADTPVELAEALAVHLADPIGAGLEGAIADGIAYAVRENIKGVDLTERDDRLPLDRAQREVDLWGTRSPSELVRHILESWILAQHVYWSVGRGLADARARGKSILRLKVVLEDDGWTLTPGASLGSPPALAGDRLETILSLVDECKLMFSGVK